MTVYLSPGNSPDQNFCNYCKGAVETYEVHEAKEKLANLPLRERAAIALKWGAGLSAATGALFLYSRFRSAKWLNAALFLSSCGATLGGGLGLGTLIREKSFKEGVDLSAKEERQKKIFQDMEAFVKRTGNEIAEAVMANPDTKKKTGSKKGAGEEFRTVSEWTDKEQKKLASMWKQAASRQPEKYLFIDQIRFHKVDSPPEWLVRAKSWALEGSEPTISSEQLADFGFKLSAIENSKNRKLEMVKWV
ncbi:MAG: hypothetical protein AB7F31_07255 [Parachlamydiales bacterium]